MGKNRVVIIEPKWTVHRPIAGVIIDAIAAEAQVTISALL